MKFSTVWDCDYWMNSNGFYAGFNMPEALISKGSGDEEYKHGLPPYAKRKSFLVDEFPACPKNWMRSEGKLTSYFVPVQEDRGMWLDFNRNSNHKYHVAIVISVQGINPITGLPCKDAALEQYIECCPKCKIKFGPNRFCEKCGYRWPKQNYISTTATPNGQLWLDGFRSAEGIVRQYILSQDKVRGVASNVIGESRVFAVGLSFFISKEPKPATSPLRWEPRSLTYVTYDMSSNTVLQACSANSSPNDPLDLDSKTTVEWNDNTICDTSSINRIGGIISHDETPKCKAPSSLYLSSPDMMEAERERKSIGNSGTKCAKSSFAKYAKDPRCSARIISRQGAIPTAHIQSIQAKKVEVGAGANINQAVFDDPMALDYWRNEPESILCVSYVLEDDAINIIKSGRISKAGHKEGFLKDIPIGNV